MKKFKPIGVSLTEDTTYGKIVSIIEHSGSIHDGSLTINGKTYNRG